MAGANHLNIQCEIDENRMKKRVPISLTTGRSQAASAAATCALVRDPRKPCGRPVRSGDSMGVRMSWRENEGMNIAETPLAGPQLAI